jgi:hypothetical protein
MKSSQITRILSGMGISGTTGLQVPAFKTIVLTTNHGVDYNNDIITFDTANSLTKIKSFRCKAINGRFSNRWTKIENGLVFPDDIINLSVQHKWYPFRNARVGDIVLIVRNGELLSSPMTTISSVSYNKVLFKDDIDIQSGDIILYVDPVGYNTHPVSDPLDPSLLLSKTPLSKYQYDIYLDTEEIIGFEMVMGRVANS